LSADQTSAAVRLALPGLARHHCLSIDDAVVDAIVEQSRPAAGQQPAKAIALADAACARARVAGSSALELVHVYLAAGSLDAGESD
jgi:ATP-dependent Clp protease ATP-binding subunit ClpA